MTDQHLPQRIDRLDRLSRTMDTAFRVPVINYRIGWDTILGLIPGIGDVAALAPSAYIVLESHRMGLPRHKVVRQCVNCGLDFAVGSVPILGDIFDATFKANRKNVAILRDHFETDMKTVPAESEDRLASHHPELGSPR